MSTNKEKIVLTDCTIKTCTFFDIHTICVGENVSSECLQSCALKSPISRFFLLQQTFSYRCDGEEN